MNALVRKGGWICSSSPVAGQRQGELSNVMREQYSENLAENKRFEDENYFSLML